MLHGGGVVAYPTEAVWGLGCDPLDYDAVWRILDLKQRSWRMGLILIASDLQQLEPYILPLDSAAQATLIASWPGPVTWLVPCAAYVPRWLRGEHDSIAVRVSAHPVARALCEAFGGALVSTSANVSGIAPARNALTVHRYFGTRVDCYVHGATDRQARPSEIRDLRNGRVVRPG